MPKGQEKLIPLRGKQYTIKKMTPDNACYWAAKVLGNVFMAIGGTSEEMMKQIQSFILSLDKTSFKELKIDALSVAYSPFQSGPYPVIDPNGNLTDTELDAVDIFQLTVHSFMWSLSDFLDQSRMEGLLDHNSAPAPVPDLTQTLSDNFSIPPSDTNIGNNINSGMGVIQ